MLKPIDNLNMVVKPNRPTKWEKLTKATTECGTMHILLQGVTGLIHKRMLVEGNGGRRKIEGFKRQ